jgi:hypothetical protein
MSSATVSANRELDIYYAALAQPGVKLKTGSRRSNTAMSKFCFSACKRRSAGVEPTAYEPDVARGNSMFPL